MTKKIISILMIFVLSLSLIACGDNKDSKSQTIKIAHKNYTEQRITGQLLAIYLESKGYKTEVKELAGTMLCYNALKNGNVDIYPEFTGSAYTAVFKQIKMLGQQETYDYVKTNCEKEHGITWLTPLGWNNTYVLSVRKDTVDKYNLKTISDLEKVSKELIVGGNVEFLDRTDGLKGLKTVYTNLGFKKEVAMDQGLTYSALKNGQIDVNSSFSTDGRIAKFGFINLEDDKEFFPPYFVTPILRLDYAKENPEIVKALKELGNKWSNDELQKYNLMVDEGENPKAVATKMLKEKNLIK
ncbi:glycine betaine ABC transporter substrate-binding protein [Clostridiaceae bacterium M8S5]|nr:glycine betaine ABC transporter substrate-binding protein [Clostridiaceae bacterium M8S5]